MNFFIASSLLKNMNTFFKIAMYAIYINLHGIFGRNFFVRAKIKVFAGLAWKKCFTAIICSWPETKAPNKMEASRQTCQHLETIETLISRRYCPNSAIIQIEMCIQHAVYRV